MKKLLVVVIIIAFFFLGLFIGQDRSNKLNSINSVQIRQRYSSALDQCAADYKSNLDIIDEFSVNNEDIYAISDEVLKDFEYYLYEPNILYDKLKDINQNADYNLYLTSQTK